FYDSYRTPRDLRSFPTRRSSDLAADAAAAIGVKVGQIVKSLVFLVDGEPTMALVAGDNRLDEAKLAAAAGGAHVERPDGDAVRRSEEHTSELQSRSDLVCRLLLE